MPLLQDLDRALEEGMAAFLEKRNPRFEDR
jgi:hypothetical protein